MALTWQNIISNTKGHQLQVILLGEICLIYLPLEGCVYSCLNALGTYVLSLDMLL